MVGGKQKKSEISEMRKYHQHLLGWGGGCGWDRVGVCGLGGCVVVLGWVCGW